MQINRQKLNHHPLYRQIVEQMLEKIRAGELLPGEKLPTESEIAQTFGVGRNSVREAMKSLAIAGIVHSRAGRGSFISMNAKELVGFSNQLDFSQEKNSLVEMIEVRLFLEVGAAGLAAEKGTENEFSELKRKLDLLKKDVSDNRSWSANGLSFHLQIAKMSKNSWLVYLLEHIAEELETVREALSACDFDVETMLEDHVAICKYICRREVRMAQACMENHLKRVMDSLHECQIRNK